MFSAVYWLCIVSFCSDLFQDLSQLQETWLTEGETCLWADFPLKLLFFGGFPFYDGSDTYKYINTRYYTFRVLYYTFQSVSFAAL